MAEDSPTLAPEILDLVVQSFCQPPHPLQYGYQPLQLSTILRLCLCNHSLYTFTVPRLYSSIYLEHWDQYPKFCQAIRSNTRLAEHTHSIFFKDIPDALSEQCLAVLIEILEICGPYLRRIVLDRPLRLMWPEDDVHGQRPLLRSALEKCRLEEFTSIQCELFLKLQEDIDSMVFAVVWPQWTSLRKLCVRNPLWTIKCTEALARLPLEEIRFHNPDPEWDETEICRPLLQRIDASKPLTILMIAWPDQVWRAQWWCLASKELCKELGDSKVVLSVVLSKVDDATDDPVDSWHELLRETTRDGSEWDLEGVEFSRWMELHGR